MKPNHHNHASPCATSPARHTSSTRFFTKLLTASAVGIFTLMLAAPNTEANAGTGAQSTTEIQKTQNMLIPQITLCKSLREAGSSWEVRGKQYEEILNALKAFDVSLDHASYMKVWETARGIASPQPLKSDASKSDLQKDCLQLVENVRFSPFAGAGNAFPLSLKTTFRSSGNGKTLFFIGLRNRNNWPSLAVIGKWEEHPDGIGYISTWGPKCNPSLIVAASQKEYNDFSKAIDDYGKEQLERVRKDAQRVNLGDMTEEEARQKSQQIREETKAAMWTKALKWAEGL